MAVEQKSVIQLLYGADDNCRWERFAALKDGGSTLTFVLLTFSVDRAMQFLFPGEMPWIAQAVVTVSSLTFLMLTLWSFIRVFGCVIKAAARVIYELQEYRLEFIKRNEMIAESRSTPLKVSKTKGKKRK